MSQHTKVLGLNGGALLTIATMRCSMNAVHNESHIMNLCKSVTLKATVLDDLKAD